jgi:transposase
MKDVNTEFKNKTIVREMIFSAYSAMQMDTESVISRLEISRRQFYRLRKKFYTTGTLTHGLCGKSSNRSISEDTKAKVLSLYKEKYQGFNYEHFSELLLEYENINISSDTLRMWLLEAKLKLPKHRKPKKYMRRTPKPCFNDMLQLDGTFDDFLGNGKMQCLMHLVDDATKTSLAYLYDAESTQSALDILYKWCCKYGVPKSIYSDRHSTYKVNERQRLTVEEELEGKEIRLTEFGKVCERLGIKQIFAYSPQAKGRVEKKHQLYKDRFIKELRLHGISTFEVSNTYLARENGFADKLNHKFTIKALEASPTIMLPTAAELAQHFTIDTTRTVRNDYTISYNGQILQLAKASVVNARSKVRIKLCLDGSVTVFAGKQQVDHTVIENYVKPIVEKQYKQTVQRKQGQNISPWRRYTPKTYSGRKPSTSDYLEKTANFYT